MSEPLEFRFSLSTLMLTIGIVSVALAVLTATPDIWATAIIILLLQIVPALLVAGLVWGRCNFRVFCLGALIPAGVTLLWAGMFWIGSLFDPVESFNDLRDALREYGFAHRCMAGLSWACSAIVGMSCVVMRRLIARWRAEKAAPPHVG